MRLSTVLAGDADTQVLGGSWDAAYKATQIVLSNGNLTATTSGGSGYQRVLGTTKILSRKVFKMQANADGDISAGIAARDGLYYSSAANPSALVGGSGNSIGYYQDGKILRCAGGSYTQIGTITPYVNGDVVHIDFDPILQQIRFAGDSGSFSSWFSTSALTGPFYAAAAAYRDSGGENIVLDPS